MCPRTDISPKYDKLTNGRTVYRTWILHVLVFLGLLIKMAPRVYKCSSVLSLKCALMNYTHLVAL